MKIKNVSDYPFLVTVGPYPVMTADPSPAPAVLTPDLT